MGDVSKSAEAYHRCQPQVQQPCYLGQQQEYMPAENSSRQLNNSEV